MAKLTGTQFADKWANRISASTPDIQRGVEAVTASPTAKAAAKKDKWLAGIQKAATSGKWENSLKNVTLEQWKAQMIGKGVPRINAGANSAKDKMSQFGEKLMAYQDAGKSKIASMPDLTLEDNINRVSTWLRYMADFKK